jgi:hypothetical protein
MASREKRDGPRKEEPQAPEQQPQKQNGVEATPPVYSRRYWTGSAALEIAVFSRVVESGSGNSFTSYSTGVKRTYKDDAGEYKETRYLRPEDLLVAAHALGEAFAWITSEQQKG